MFVTGFPAGPWGTNCFLVAAEKNSECVIVDPGMDAVAQIEDLVRENGLRPVAVMLSHGHLDHTWSVYPVCNGYSIPAYVHSQDDTMLSDPLSGLSSDMTMALQQLTGGQLHRIEPDDVRPLDDFGDVDIAGLPITVRHGPGHTRGSVSFHLPASDVPPVMLSGDLLFAGSIGRTDLPGGDHAAMMRSLGDVVLPLDDETVVLPGHGPQTTVGRERATNPYLRQLLTGDGTSPGAARRGM